MPENVARAFARLGDEDDLVLEQPQILQAVVTPTPMAGTHQEVSDDSLCNNYDILDLENSETIILELSEEFPTYKKADDLRKPKNPALTPLYLKNNRPLQNRNCDPSSGDSNRIVMELAEAGALKEKTPKRSEEKRTSTNNESSGVKVRHKRGPQSTVTAGRELMFYLRHILPRNMMSCLTKERYF
ncbi:hypothetical protein NQ315_002705 [Exocentrus adspersus]|uniref:Uncharacterized protein n=1 Tax=Exocentrus adspersus TaxID=1586481 RepID=A0AAV8VHT1_9CUCU|nr:hypothetical protein NQ315_002705 [Exocentrus adspersus]